MRVALDHITKKFGDFTAVSEFSAVLEDGELVSLLGPSGCGKSTLLNMLSGILPVSGGKIFFDNQDVTLMHRKSAVLVWFSRIMRCIRT